jgi:hypothetical protein
LRGLLAAERGNSWYASIAEFRPLFLAEHVTFSAQGLEALNRFGLLPVLAGLGILQLRWSWTHEPRLDRDMVLAVLGVTFTLLTAYMSRFAYYAALPLALFGAMGAAWVARASAPGDDGHLASPVPAVVALAPSVPALRPRCRHSSRFVALERAAASRWNRDGARGSVRTMGRRASRPVPIRRPRSRRPRDRRRRGSHGGDGGVLPGGRSRGGCRRA